MHFSLLQIVNSITGNTLYVKALWSVPVMIKSCIPIISTNRRATWMMVWQNLLMKI